VAAELPANVARLFWDTDPEQVDLRAHRDYVMERVMSRGSWSAMRWLRDTYSTDEMADFLVRKGHRIAPHDLAYWSLIEGIERPTARGGGRPPWTRP
jgi:hypothetical protein